MVVEINSELEEKLFFKLFSLLSQRFFAFPREDIIQLS